MGFEFLTASLGCQHSQVEQAPLLLAQGFVAPADSKAILGDELLKLPVEVVCGTEGFFYEFFPHNSFALPQTSLEACLIHGYTLPSSI